MAVNINTLITGTMTLGTGGSTPEPATRTVTRVWWSDDSDYSDCPANNGTFGTDCLPEGKYNFNAVKIEFGSDVMIIGESAFQWCDGLTSVTIPDSVTSIEGDSFEGCSGITSVTITANGGNANNVKQMMIDAGVSESITWNMPS